MQHNTDNINNLDISDNHINNNDSDNDNDNDNNICDDNISPNSLLKHIDNIDKNTENTLEEQINNVDDNNPISDIINNLKALGNEDSLNNLFKDFTDSFQNTNHNHNHNNNNNSNDDDEDDSENYDFETLNLDKYLLDDSGSNICTILSNINNQLININNNLDKLHDK